MNKIQSLHLEIIKLSSFNGFDGEKVVSDLIENQNLWISICTLNPDCPLIGLRDMDKDSDDDWWNTSTLYIKPKEGKEKELLSLSYNWYPTEVEWLNNGEAGDLLGIGFAKDRNKNDKRLLRLWWD